MSKYIESLKYTLNAYRVAWLGLLVLSFCLLEPTTVDALDRSSETLLRADLKPALEYSRKYNGAAVLIVKDGKILLEEYQNGRKASEANYLASGTKSFWGPVIAAMIEDGLVSSFDEPVANTITEWKNDPNKSRITVRHLLNLSSGLRENMHQIGGEGGIAKNRYEFAITLQGAHTPGSFFRYGPAHFAVLGAFMKRKLAPQKLSPLDYLKQRILDPIGAEYAEWQHDASGNPHIPNGANMTARNWAKYGQFIAQLGKWGDKQIVRRDLIEECLRGSSANPGYGLTFWLNEPGGHGFLKSQRPPAGAKSGWIYPWGYPEIAGALGAGKTRMYIFPEHGLVVVRQAQRPWDRRYIDSEFLNLVLAGPVQSEATATEVTAPAINSDKSTLSIFETLDRNSDNYLTRDEISEWRTGLWNNFDRLDKNKDGKLSLDEISQIPRHTSQ